VSEFFIGIVGMVFLYGLGKVLYPEVPEHKPIQQELIKIGDDENGQ
jgi:hypothetical protein